MTDNRELPKAGNLPVTVATWIFLLDQKGIRPDHSGIRAACDALREAGGKGEGEVDWDALAQGLVEQVSAGLGSSAPDGPTLRSWVSTLFGVRHVGSEAGASREERLQQARTYQFRQNLPWLAQIVDRFPDGTVRPHWVMVERVTDRVLCMDPYPWDDLDEAYEAPLIEFLVKWELAGCPTIRWIPDET